MKFNRDMLQKALARKMFGWVDEVLRELIPADIYASAHRGTPSERLRASNWLKEQGYRIISPGEGVVQVFKGAKLIRHTKLVLELSDPDELLKIAELVNQNVNMPRPPWQSQEQ